MFRKPFKEEVKILFLTVYKFHNNDLLILECRDPAARERDIGRKWESGRAKRKKRAERAVSNQSLRLGMMKFLKKSASRTGSKGISESIASNSKEDTVMSETLMDVESIPHRPSAQPQSEIETGSNSTQ